ncbi:putative germin-like protein 2-2 [Camellia sinensis]|uniref:Germin-like protein n=2 Tax=Camellia sinensis TaxID=4442 RepID=A0A7J7FPH0_CAMSI|nr:putative germin-like protein 2-2 [Camellia sinensis]KAF5930060.1 hypothetical protein HYC85_030933 [Camellia sinensis]THG04133.1 hypothetical protein TEA_015474 [Camellia sinensis var. sinensis]
MANLILVLSLLVSCTMAIAFEPSPLQDFCVADPTSSARVNGLACMDAKFVEAKHFFFSGLHVAGNTSNKFGFSIAPVTVAQLPGLNTLGLTMVRFDYAPSGIVPPHSHPRATEIITVLKGTIEVGFVTSNPDNRLISKVLHMGDVFVFPVGLIHFQRNVGWENAISISALSSQNPGLVFASGAVFGSNPPMPVDLVAKAFQIDKGVVYYLQTIF